MLLCLLWLACAPSEGPEPVAWDRTRCARCGMLVSEPASAAQRRTAANEVLHYDDPGCLLVSLPQDATEGDELYFHHWEEDRWLAGAEVRFAEVASTPMGYGLAAVGDQRFPDAMTLADARQRSLARDLERSKAREARASK